MMFAFLLVLIIVQFVDHFHQAVKHQLEWLLFEVVVGLIEYYLIVKLENDEFVKFSWKRILFTLSTNLNVLSLLRLLLFCTL
jgi:hypothetical protein